MTAMGRKRTFGRAGRIESGKRFNSLGSVRLEWLLKVSPDTRKEEAAERIIELRPRIAVAAPGACTTRKAHDGRLLIEDVVDAQAKLIIRADVEKSRYIEIIVGGQLRISVAEGVVRGIFDRGNVRSSDVSPMQRQ